MKVLSYIIVALFVCGAVISLLFIDDENDKPVITAEDVIPPKKGKIERGCWTNLDGSKAISVSCTAATTYIKMCTVCGTQVGKEKVMCRSFNQESCF